MDAKTISLAKDPTIMYTIYNDARPNGLPQGKDSRAQGWLMEFSLRVVFANPTVSQLFTQRVKCILYAA